MIWGRPAGGRAPSDLTEWHWMGRGVLPRVRRRRRRALLRRLAAHLPRWDRRNTG
jgi:hypothetical protein